MKIKTSDFRYGILDIEGTLLDNKKLYRKLLAILGYLSYLDILDVLLKNSFEAYLPSGGILLPWPARLIYRCLPWLKFPVLAGEKVILFFFEVIDEKEPELFTGAKELLMKFQEEEILLFGSSGSKTVVIENHLKRLELLDLFALVVGADQAPKREHLHLFADYLNLPFEEFAQQAFWVSDGLVDINLCRKYKVYGIGVAHTHHPVILRRVGAKEVIPRLKELVL